MGTVTKDQAARELANRHFEVESGLTHIFRLAVQPEVERNASEPIKLLEVNEATVSSGIVPLHFGPAPAHGIPFSSVIVEVTPDEYERILNQQLGLPRGWTIREEILRPIPASGGAA